MNDAPALDPSFVDRPTVEALTPVGRTGHPPRILLLYGSLRQRSFSRFLVEEADRLLRGMGAETRIFDPRGLPRVDDAPLDHPKVEELLQASLWSEGRCGAAPSGTAP